jgi:hypothetical protein
LNCNEQQHSRIGALIRALRFTRLEAVRRVFKTPVSVEIVPPPSLMPPFQTADAFLMVMFAPWIAVPQCRARGKPALRAGAVAAYNPAKFD